MRTCSLTSWQMLSWDLTPHLTHGIIITHIEAKTEMFIYSIHIIWLVLFSQTHIHTHKWNLVTRLHDHGQVYHMSKVPQLFEVCLGLGHQVTVKSISRVRETENSALMLMARTFSRCQFGFQSLMRTDEIVFPGIDLKCSPRSCDR